MKKLLSYLLVIALVLVQCLPVLTVNAENGTNEVKDGTITISNAVVGETYEIYKMFDLESYDTDKEAYTYTISTTSEWYEFVSTGAGKDYVTLSEYEEGKKIVTWNQDKATDTDVATFARLALDYAETEGIDNSDSKTAAENETVKFTDLELGYYLVDSSLGALVSLNTTVRAAEIEEKNTAPSIDKTVEENGTYGDYNNDEIGSTVKYKVEISAKKGAQNYVLTDKMTTGLTFNDDVVVTVGTTKLVEGTDYTIVYPGESDTFTFKVKFTKAYQDKITADTTIVVTYSATINEEAVINGTGNINEAKLTYGDGTDTAWDETRTYVLSFELVKTDGQNELLGAEFELYTSSTEDTKINLVEEEDENGNTYYRVATTEEANATDFVSAVIKVGSVYIEGLDAGTYYLEETKAPEGYNKLTSRVAVTLVTNLDGAGNHTTTLGNEDSNLLKYENDQVQVVNTTGSMLPSTGGMGTVAFIAIGSIMVLGFGVLLVTKLRMSKMTI